MAEFEVELVGKIGSMALINKEYNDINFNIMARLCAELRPGYVWVTSGATEIGRLDYIKRHAKELDGNDEDNKTDYAAQGQSILMMNYRRYIDAKFSIRQILVEHQNFNDETKRERLRKMLLRAPMQQAIPIINYNDAVSYEENVKIELQLLKEGGKKIVHCVDNDETASQIACLVRTKTLLILTSTDGIYADPKNEKTLLKEIGGKDIYELLDQIEQVQKVCDGASRKGAGGAKAKLEYIKEPLKMGSKVIIANSKYYLNDILSGNAPRTLIGVR